MQSEIKKNHRKSKSFYANYLGGIFSSLGVSFFFFFGIKDNHFVWSLNLIWGSGVALVFIIIFAVVGNCLQKDEMSKREFRLSFFLGIICSILVVSLILLKDLILSRDYSILITFFILILIYFPLNYIFIKLWKDN